MAIVAHGAALLEAGGLVTEKSAGWRFEASGAVRDGDNALELVCEHPLRKMINYLCMIPRSRCGFVGCQQASRLALSAS